MEELFSVFFRGFIAEFLGRYTRYFFYKIAGRRKTLKYLSGDDTNTANNASQALYNMIVGFVVFLPLSVGIAYIYFG